MISFISTSQVLTPVGYRGNDTSYYCFTKDQAIILAQIHASWRVYMENSQIIRTAIDTFSLLLAKKDQLIMNQAEQINALRYVDTLCARDKALITLGFQHEITDLKATNRKLRFQNWALKGMVVAGAALAVKLLLFPTPK